MAFKLHGYNISTCTRRVAQIAKERNIPYELVPIDLPSLENKQEVHIAHHPFGQMPYITVRPPSVSCMTCAVSYYLAKQQDDGFELYESRAIGRYLATLGSGPELIPTDPKARAKFEQAASVEYAQFDPIAGGILHERVFKQFHGLPADEERVKELVPQLESKLDVYEVILSKQKYLAGDVRSFHSKCVQKTLSVLTEYFV